MTGHKTILAAASLALVVALPGSAQAQNGRSIFSALDTQGRTVSLGEEMPGNLSTSDVLSAGGRRVQVWTLGAMPGEEIQVDLRSDDFDAFLYVVGPGLEEGIRDDDGGSGLDSRICFTPDQPGEYRVVASSLGAGTGAFTISATPTGGTCGGAVSTTEVEDLSALPTEGRAISVGDDVSGNLTSADATFYGSPSQAWAVQGVAGAPFSVDLISDEFDAFLTLLGPGLDDWITDDDGAGRCDSRVSLTFPESGEYRVIVSTLGTGNGAFRLLATEAPGPADPQSCIPPATTDSGGYEYVEGSLEDIEMMGALGMESTVNGAMQGGEGVFRDRPLQGWTLEGMAGNRVAITLVSDQFDTYLFFDGPGFVDPLSDDDSAGDLDSRICVELPETGTYRVFAGPLSSASAGAPYRLDATVRRAGELCGDDFDISPDRMMETLAGLDTQGRTIAVNEEQYGTLDGSASHPESDRPVQPWTLRGEAGTYVYVDVVTDNFDAYLYAVGADLEGGMLTADDHSGSLNPRMELTIPPSGTVLLLPSAFSTSARGDFMLRVSTNPPPLEMSEGGSGQAGTLTDSGELDGIGLPVGDLPFGTEVSGALGVGDDEISRGYAQAFTYQGEAGETVVFELVSDDFDCYLYLAGPGLGGVLSDDDGAGNLDSRIEVTLPESGTYTVVASALSEGSTGAFRLRAFRVAR